MIETVKKFDFKDFDRLFKESINNMPKEIGRMAVTHFKHGFDTGGGQTDDSIGGWKERKKSNIFAKNDKRRGWVKGAEKPILYDTGALKRSIRLGIASRNMIRIYAKGIVYGRIHNDGLEGNAFGHRFKMPKRNFLGHSKKLDEKIIYYINTELRKLNRR